MMTRYGIVWGWALMMTLAAATGCKTTGYQQADKTAASLKASARTITQSQDQLDKVITALNGLASQSAGDMTGRYKTFESAVAKLESLAAETNRQNQAVQQQKQDYLKSWDAELAKVKNEDIKARSEARRNQVAAAFDNLRQQYDDVSNAYQPFMSDLNDIKAALSVDLTPAGVAAIAPNIQKASQSAVPLKKELGELADAFKTLSTEMSSSKPSS